MYNKEKIKNSEEEEVLPSKDIVVKDFDVPCYINGKLSSVKIMIGDPKIGTHPIQHQNKFLMEEKGIVIPKEILDTLEKLLDIAQRNGVSFTELCEYALKSLEASNFIKKENKTSDIEPIPTDENSTIAENKNKNE